MSLFETRMQNLRTSTNIDKYEYRASRYGAIDLFLTETANPTGIVTPDMLNAARQSIGRTLEVPVINFDAGVAIGGARTLTVADSENTSEMVTFVFNTYAWGFTMTPAMYMNNEIGMERDWNTKFMKYLMEFANVLDGLALSVLEANRTTVINDTLIYNEVGEAIQAPHANRETLLGDINPMMAANDYYDQIHVVGNTGIESLVRNLTEKGLYNEINKQLQYSDKIFHLTNNLVNAGGVYGTGYAVNAGSVGLMSRLEREALRGGRSYNYEFGTEVLPLISQDGAGRPLVEVGTMYYEDVDDFSNISGGATADMDRAIKEHYGFAVDIAFVVRHNSRPGVDPDPILKFEILNP